MCSSEVAHGDSPVCPQFCHVKDTTRPLIHSERKTKSNYTTHNREGFLFRQDLRVLCMFVLQVNFLRRKTTLSWLLLKILTST